MARTKPTSVLRSVLFNRQKLVVFTVCLFISSLFWVLLAFNGTYSTVVEVPVKYINIPEGNLLLGRLPTTLKIEISGSGYLLSSYLLQPDQAEVILDGRQIGISSTGNSDEAFLTTIHGIDFFNQAHSDVRLLHISPDTLFFTFSKQAHRKIPVHLVKELSFEKQYDLIDSIFLQPDSVTISGPAGLLDSIYRIRTERLVLSGINKSGTYKLNLQRPESRLSYAPAEVKVTLNVDKFTEASISVPVTIDHLNNKDSISIFPEVVQLVYLVSLRDYNRIKPNLFHVTMDANDLKTNKGSTLRLNIKKQPSFIKLIRMEPESTEFIIRKK